MIYRRIGLLLASVALVGFLGCEGKMGEPGATGAMGEPGATGAMGEPGAMGDPGVHCWDLDGSGSCDLATEDQDGSGACDALDCSVRDVVDTDMTITVSDGTCPSLIAAIRSLDTMVIVRPATVTIDVSGGPYDCDQTLVFDPPYGDRIAFIGNSSGTPTTIQFQDATGIEIRPLRRVGSINGFALDGGGGTGGFDGIVVDSGANVVLGADVVVEEFADQCYLVNNGAVLRANDTTARGCGSHGYSALEEARLYAARALSENNGTHGFRTIGGTIVAADAISRNNGANGFSAAYNASIVANGSEARNNGRHGYLAFANATIRADDATAAQNGTGGDGDGFHATSASHVYATGAKSNNNQGSGYVAHGDSSVDVRNSSASGNGASGYCASTHSYLDRWDWTGGSACITVNAPGTTREYIRSGQTPP